MHHWFRHQFARPYYPQHLWLDGFDQFNDCILLVDEHCNVIHYNQAWQNFIHSGYSSPQQSPTLQTLRDLKRYIYPDDLYAITQLLSPIKYGDEQHIRLIHQQQLFWFNLRCQAITERINGKNYYYFFLREQTQQIKQAALRSAQQRSLDGLLQRLPMMLYRSRNDRNWTMEFVNEGCQHVTGYSAQQLINSPLYGQRIHPDDSDYVWSSVQQALDHKQVFELVYRWKNAHDQMIEVREIGQGLYSSSDMILGVEGIISRNFTEGNPLP